MTRTPPETVSTYASTDADVRARCVRFLSYHHPRTAREWLLDLAAAPGQPEELDFYGTGAPLAALESRCAELLGKEAAVFMPSATTAQQAALRVWADETAKRTVALHPLAHIHHEEQDAYEQLHGLEGILLTREARYPCAEDFAALKEPIGTLLIELPLRRLTYALPEWSEVTRLAAAARASGARIHLDGARLFECTPWYAQPIAALAEIANSVCVSVYKGLGGLAGAVLAGPAPLISQARVWQHRHGGRLHSLFPLARAASVGLQRHLPRIPEYVANARALAHALSAVPALSALPAEPCINAFQLHFHDVQPERLQRLHRLRATATGSWLFNWFQPSAIPGATFVDVVMGDALDHWSIAAAVAAIRDLASDVSAL